RGCRPPGGPEPAAAVSASPPPPTAASRRCSTLADRAGDIRSAAYLSPRLPGGAVPAVSLLVLAVLAQPVQHRVEVLGRGGHAFWAAGPRGSDSWERVRGDIQLEARRSAEGATTAELSLHLTRNAESWTVELSALRPDSVLIDGDLPGPGGRVHAAVALGGTARVT